MNDGPFKDAFESDDSGVIRRELITYRMKDGVIRKEIATREYFGTYDYFDSHQTVVLVKK